MRASSAKVRVTVLGGPNGVLNLIAVIHIDAHSIAFDLQMI